MFSSNDILADGSAFAAKFGGIISLDDITHISSVEEELGQLLGTVSCHYNPSGIFELSSSITDNPGDSKYNTTPAQITEAFCILETKGVKHLGLHAPLTGNVTTNEYYPKLAEVLLHEAVRSKEKAGAKIASINLSGGVGVSYRPGQQVNGILTIGHEVRKAYGEILTSAEPGNVAVYVEIRHFMLALYDAFITEIICEKHVYEEYTGVDTRAANLMRPVMYKAYCHITVLSKENMSFDHVYNAIGPPCENNDKFAIDRELPEVEMRNCPRVHSTDVHGFSTGYNYNGKLRGAEPLFREDDSVQLIRRAETPKDHFTTSDLYNAMDKYPRQTAWW